MADLIKAARASLAGGDLPAAKALLNQVLRVQPHSVDAHTYLGIIADQEGRSADAEREFAAAVAAAPQSPEAHNNYGAALWRRGRSKPAAREFELSLRLNPSQAGALVNLAQIRFAQGTPAALQSAHSLFERAWSLSPDVEIARARLVTSLRLEDSEHAAAEYADYNHGVAASAVLPPISARLELGSALLQAGLFPQAELELTAVVTADPGNDQAVVALARAYQKRNDFPSAGKVLEAAVARGVESASIYSTLADVYQTTHHVENAIPAMRRAIELSPQSEAYRFRYAMLLTDTSAPQAAVIRLRESLQQFPQSASLWFALGIAQAADNRDADAAGSFKHALVLDPKLSGAFAYLGMMDVDQGHTESGIASYEKALAIDNRSAVVHYLLAEALVKLTPPDYPSAEQHLKRARALDSSFVQAQVSLGKLYLASERYSDAVRELENAIKAAPDMSEPYYQLSRAYTRLRRRDDARAAAAKFEQLSSAQKQQSQQNLHDLVRRLAEVRF